MRRRLPLFADLFGIRPWEIDQLARDEIPHFLAYANARLKQQQNGG